MLEQGIAMGRGGVFLRLTDNSLPSSSVELASQIRWTM
jgi:hypothetical protein